MPEVSVVIPTYNRAATVERAIQSALAQTLPPLEVIVVDDASDDRTEERLGMIRSPLLQVIRHAQNRGAAGARNSGIEAARGDFIAFLDADDEWLPNKLTVQLPQLLSAPAHTAVSCTGAMMHLLDHARQLEIHPTDTPDWHRRLLLGCDLSPGTTLLALRSVFEKLGLFDVALRRFEDWDWLIRYTKIGPDPGDPGRAGKCIQPPRPPWRPGRGVRLLLCRQEQRDWLAGQAAKLSAEKNLIASQLQEMAERIDKLETERNVLAARHEEQRIGADTMLARVLGKLSVLEYRLQPPRAPNNKAAATSENPLVGRYLDLLESALVGALTEDPAMAYFRNGFDPEIRFVGRDWPQSAVTMIGTARMRNIRHLVERVLVDKVPGALIETGVWRGGVCIYMRGILAAHGITDRKVWVADSFCGLPTPDPDQFPEDTGDIHHTYKELAVPLAEVKRNFQRFGLLDDQVEFLGGWFKDTLTTAPIERLALLRVDADMYQSTMEALEALYRKLSPGGFVIIDDYLLDPCRLAVGQFRSRHGITSPLEAVDGAAVFWREMPAAGCFRDVSFDERGCT
jgi:O-methyltransferase/8-demethyl-8-(2,3-dimethoxy-alpha-L-rhamnosyl)tetracenomycin-C 4'-O-methyltransferase